MASIFSWKGLRQYLTGIAIYLLVLWLVSQYLGIFVGAISAWVVCVWCMPYVFTDDEKVLRKDRNKRKRS